MRTSIDRIYMTGDLAMEGTASLGRKKGYYKPFLVPWKSEKGT